MADHEFPLRVVELAGGGIVIRALCGAESALVKPAADQAAPIMLAARQNPVRNRGISPDASAAGVLRMVLHAKTCLRCKNAARELAAASGVA